MGDKKHIILENGVYLLIWLLVLTIPFYAYNGESSLRWHDIMRYWIRLSPFILLFVLSNFLLIPKLLLKKRYIQYISITIGIIVLLFIITPLIRINSIEYRGAIVTPNRMDIPPPGNRPVPPEFQRNNPPTRDGLGPRNRRAGEIRPPMRGIPIKWGPLLESCLVALLLVGCNIAGKFVFKSIRDERILKEVESQNLQAELKYLKANINPHFFMNVLNNIHALIDIDGDKAKQTVIELSTIMRYVLYDSDRPLVPIQKEVDFLNDYINLMRIRFCDDIEIINDYPEKLPDVMIPPLLLITLVENAFKHGISYQNRSFVHIKLSFDINKLIFRVENSFLPNRSGKTGIGLINLRKRIALLFAQDATLDLNSSEEIFTANLIIPINV